MNYISIIYPKEEVVKVNDLKNKINKQFPKKFCFVELPQKKSECDCINVTLENENSFDYKSEEDIQNILNHLVLN
jgi:hypothetical protein